MLEWSSSAALFPENDTRKSGMGASPRFVVRFIEVSAAVVAAAAAVAMLWAAGGTKHDKGDNLPPSQGTTDQTQSEAGGATHASQAGPCFSHSSTVPCTTEHDTERFSARHCTDSTLVDYLGGDPDVEVLSPKVEIRTASKGCLITFAPPSEESLRDLFRGGEGGAYRYCVDELPKMTYASCSSPHSGEIVGLEAVSRGPLQCEEVATIYMGTPWAQVSNDLSMVKVTNSDQVGCLAEVRGDNFLTETVRDLGQNALPLASH